MQQFEGRTTGFEDFADRYAATNADLSIGYRISEAALLQVLYPHLITLRSQGVSPHILEVGAGIGTSTARMIKTMEKWGVFPIEWIATERNISMIEQGKNRDDAWPVSCADVQDLSQFPDASFHAVVSSQMIHWVDNIPQALREMYRVLQPESPMIACSSGLLSGMDSLHFTEHPMYKKFLAFIEQYLSDNKLWNRESDGIFSPKNPLVNSFFHRYSVVQMLKMIEQAGFVNAALSYHRVPINRREMVDVRMQKGSTFMFLWNGQKTRELPREIADNAVDRARGQMETRYAAELDALDTEPSDDATLRFVGWKPQTAKNII